MMFTLANFPVVLEGFFTAATTESHKAGTYRSVGEG